MDQALRKLLERLSTEGEAHDAAEPDRLRRRRNLEPASAALLWSMLRLMHPTTVVEIGTSNGVSTLWFADALAGTGGRLVSVDNDPLAIEATSANLERAGLAGGVELVLADGGQYLNGLGGGSVDVLFLDAERVEYDGWWPDPVRVVRPGGALVADNVLSHPDEVKDLLARVDREPGVTSTTVPVGKGLYLAVLAT